MRILGEGVGNVDILTHVVPGAFEYLPVLSAATPINPGLWARPEWRRSQGLTANETGYVPDKRDRPVFDIVKILWEAQWKHCEI